MLQEEKLLSSQKGPACLWSLEADGVREIRTLEKNKKTKMIKVIVRMQANKAEYKMQDMGECYKKRIC